MGEGVIDRPAITRADCLDWLPTLEAESADSCVTPPGGVIPEPFAGSGTTCIAAGLEGFDFLACEREEEYVQIAEARLAHWVGEPERLQLPISA